MRQWAHAAAAWLALSGPALAQQDNPAGLPPEQVRQELAMIDAALKAGLPLDPAARSHRFDQEEATRLFAGKRWTFVTMHVESRYDFFVDGRLRTTNLPSPPYYVPKTVRVGKWSIDEDKLCLIFAETGKAETRKCIVGYVLGNAVALGATDNNSPPKGILFGVLGSPEAIPDE
ncbi:hypothetical protein [Xanthobacter sp.]|uniref:hypothetical protein n=1 Tax=Xanthobacter sp. TaxID=35809 RepID=UPI0025F14214|nr:hypothetical protein [Xanthobacter sp.]